MVTITHRAVTREQVQAAFRRAHEVWLHERYHSILLLMGGQSGPEVAQRLYRNEETIRHGARAFNEAGLLGLKRASSPRRPA